MTSPWPTMKLMEAASFIKDGTHFSPASKCGPYRYLTSKNVRDGYMDLSDCCFISEEDHRRIYKDCPVEFGDVLLTKDGASVGNVCQNQLAEQFSLLSSVAVIRGKPDLLLNDFLLQYFLSPFGKKAILDEVTGLAITRITVATVTNLRIPVPPLNVQVAISSLLSVWDRGLRQLSDMIAAKILFKRGLVQQLLAGKRRFMEFRDEWRPVNLKDVTEECDERNRGRLGTDSVMAVTKAEGIIPMRERTIAADIDRYSVVKRDCFAYNPMRLNIGSIARWSGENDILVSPDYVVFRCKEEIDANFLDQFRRSGLWERYVTSSGNGSVRVRIYYADLGAMKFRLPSLAEQQKIAVLLNSADHEIDLLRKQLDALKTQKKGLMQKLLTGEFRVKEFNHG